MTSCLSSFIKHCSLEFVARTHHMKHFYLFIMKFSLQKVFLISHLFTWFSASVSYGWTFITILHLDVLLHSPRTSSDSILNQCMIKQRRPVWPQQVLNSARASNKLLGPSMVTCTTDFGKTICEFAEESQTASPSSLRDVGHLQFEPGQSRESVKQVQCQSHLGFSFFHSALRSTVKNFPFSYFVKTPSTYRQSWEVLHFKKKKKKQKTKRGNVLTLPHHKIWVTHQCHLTKLE